MGIPWGYLNPPQGDLLGHRILKITDLVSDRWYYQWMSFTHHVAPPDPRHKKEDSHSKGDQAADVFGHGCGHWSLVGWLSDDSIELHSSCLHALLVDLQNIWIGT